VHFPLTVVFLLWGFFLRPAVEYVWARNLLIVMTFLALVLHIAFPLAPPRMFPGWGFLDTGRVLGPFAYGDEMSHVANQFAAMPSLHIGWAALIAFVVARTGPRWLAALALVHAVLTSVVVVVTANHWWVDGLVSLVLLGLAVVVLPGPGRTVWDLPTASRRCPDPDPGRPRPGPASR